MIRTAITLALAATLAAPALAQETRASAAAKFKSEFAQSDADKNGALTRAEVQARIGQMKVGAKRPDPVHAKRLADLWFDRADSDKNAQVTEAEAQALLAATFKRYDADGDGKIGAGERGVAKKALAK
jgi:Ca2+-binding EF-hand superfamily protein